MLRSPLHLLRTFLDICRGKGEIKEKEGDSTFYSLTFGVHRLNHDKRVVNVINVSVEQEWCLTCDNRCFPVLKETNLLHDKLQVFTIDFEDSYFILKMH